MIDQGMYLFKKLRQAGRDVHMPARKVHFTGQTLPVTNTHLPTLVPDRSFHPAKHSSHSVSVNSF